APLYALAAMRLQIRDPNSTQQELNETKKIFDKVNGGSEAKEKSEEGMSFDLNTDIKLENDFNNAMALVNTNNQGISLFDRENIQNKINKKLIATTPKLFIKAERSLVRYQTSYKEILRTIEHANSYRAKGIAVMSSGALIGSLAGFYSMQFMSSLFGPFGLVTGAACLAGGYYFGNRLFKKGQEMFEEPTIRENLNKFINKALSAYDDEKYQEFINALSEEYDENHKRLLNCRDKIGITEIDDIVKTLRIHGFRSDAKAKTIFQMALDDELVKEARKLDRCTSKLRKTCQGSYERYFKSNYEMRNIARINIVILNIVENDKESYKMAKETIEEVQKSVEENFQFVSKAKLRLEVLEDFLWIISGEDLSDNNKSFTIAGNSTSELDNNLNNQQSFKQNEYYYNAVSFERLAEKETKINKLNSLRHWQSAQKNYKIAHKIDPDNPICFLGYARCLLKLSKYTQVIKLSDTYPGLNSLSEYWHLRSVAYSKQKNYEDAMTCNTEALSLDSGNIPAGKYREFIKKFNVDNKIEHHIDRYKKELTYKIDYLKNSHSDESPSYKILSIDGGGIRGILPALWLSEIEYRTHRPISHLFNLIAGTSTGGIVAAGLSAPKFKPIYETTYENTKDHIEYENSNLVPIFSASELLNIYKNESNKLFSKSTSCFNIFSNVHDRYTDEGRSIIFKKYFGKTRLSHSLTELVIPATNQNFSHLFTRYDAKNSKNNEANHTFVDILTATTAAPTFYPSHKIGNKTFIDGGMYLNNPASTAYDEAIRYNVPKEKISVLSLGTGCYLPDPSNPDKYNNLLFWTQTRPKLMIFAQEYETDSNMYKVLKNRYQRWQVFFEEPIRLDDYESIPNLLELGYQYIEELDCSDENPINKLVESFGLEIGID
ncbi:11449_t:CDS:2, partial [Gigaspora rosea]